jgi:putative methyltransferase (TIGR04325 family)
MALDRAPLAVKMIQVTLKKFLKSIAPPFVIDIYRFLRWGRYWEGIYASFRDVPKVGSGFSDAGYAIPTIEDTRRAILAARNYRAVPTQVVEEDAFLPLLASVVAESNGGTLRILDFGGGAGISFVHLTSGLARRAKLDYHVVELEWACEAGRRLFADDDRIQFHAALPETLPDIDIVLMKGVLMSVEDYAGLLKRICGYRARFLFIVNLAAGGFPTFASAQRNLPGIIPHWFFNLDEIVRRVSSEGYALIFKGALMEQYRQDNFPESHRLEEGRACALLFALRTGETRIAARNGEEAKI